MFCAGIETLTKALIEQCLAQPSSEKLPPAAGGNKYRDPQSDMMQRVKDLGTLSPKWDIPIKFSSELLSLIHTHTHTHLKRNSSDQTLAILNSRLFQLFLEEAPTHTFLGTPLRDGIWPPILNADLSYELFGVVLVVVVLYLHAV